MRPPCIVLACGGTGGHVFPAFSVAEELKAHTRDLRVVYACGTKDIEHALFAIVQGQPVVAVDSAPFRGAMSFVNPSFLLRLSRGFWQAMRLLRRERPLAVVGFGGHFSFPVILAAKCSGIPTVLHEQNVIPGMANKVMARFVDGVALSFPETERLLPKGARFAVTGNPIRRAIEQASRSEALERFGFSEGKKTVLVLGGSQGAESVNRVFLESLERLPETLKGELQLLHLCGKMAPELAESHFRKMGIVGRAYSFFDRMDRVYAVTDLAIGRAGATFLAEIDALSIPAVLVPYPFAGGHQMENAKAFARKNKAVIIEQERLSVPLLTETLVRECAGLGARPATARGGSADRDNARKKLADFIMSFVKA